MLPDGNAFPIELPGLDGRKIDGIFIGPKEIVHIEFQTVDTAAMPWRLLEYYHNIFAAFPSHIEAGYKIRQILIYIGREEASEKMNSPLTRDRLTFEYEYDDIRNKGENARFDLLDSKKPFDWILDVLCSWQVDDGRWLVACKQIANYCEAYPHESKNLVAYFYIAVALRKPEPSTIRRIQKMLKANIEEIDFLKEAYDLLSVQMEARSLVTSLRIYMNARAFEVDEKVLNALEDMDPTSLKEITHRVFILPDSQAIQNFMFESLPADLKPVL